MLWWQWKEPYHKNIYTQKRKFCSRAGCAQAQLLRICFERHMTVGILNTYNIVPFNNKQKKNHINNPFNTIHSIVFHSTFNLQKSTFNSLFQSAAMKKAELLSRSSFELKDRDECVSSFLVPLPFYGFFFLLCSSELPPFPIETH